MYGSVEDRIDRCLHVRKLWLLAGIVIAQGALSSCGSRIYIHMSANELPIHALFHSQKVSFQLFERTARMIFEFLNNAFADIIVVYMYFHSPKRWRCGIGLFRTDPLRFLFFNEIIQTLISTFSEVRLKYLLE